MRLTESPTYVVGTFQNRSSGLGFFYVCLPRRQLRLATTLRVTVSRTCLADHLRRRTLTRESERIQHSGCEALVNDLRDLTLLGLTQVCKQPLR